MDYFLKLLTSLFSNGQRLMPNDWEEKLIVKIITAAIKAKTADRHLKQQLSTALQNRRFCGDGAITLEFSNCSREWAIKSWIKEVYKIIRIVSLCHSIVLRINISTFTNTDKSHKRRTYVLLWHYQNRIFMAFHSIVIRDTVPQYQGYNHSKIESL